MFKIRINRSILIFILIFTSVVTVYSFIFLHIMENYENRTFDFLTAVYWVIVSMTTVGYGEIYFESGIGQIFSIVVAISGVMMIFALLFPLVITPWLDETFRKDLPIKVPVHIRDHTIICGYNQLVETLIHELKGSYIPFVVVDDNIDNIKYLTSRNVICVYGDPADDNVLISCNIYSARKLIANQSDEKNASIILTAKGLTDIEVISLIEDTAKSRYLKYAGSDRVISPKALFGNFIGRKAIDPLTDHLAGTTKIFEDISIVEFPIYPHSMLIGKRIIDARIREHTGANIVGLWTEGRLSLNPGPDNVIKENSVILAIGTEKQLESLKKWTR